MTDWSWLLRTAPMGQSNNCVINSCNSNICQVTIAKTNHNQVDCYDNFYLCHSPSEVFRFSSRKFCPWLFSLDSHQPIFLHSNCRGDIEKDGAIQILRNHCLVDMVSQTKTLHVCCIRRRGLPKFWRTKVRYLDICSWWVETRNSLSYKSNMEQ